MVRMMLVLVLVTTVVACGGSSGADPAEATTGRYEQTWTKGYSETTCDEWATSMNDHERFVAAADMLYAVWKGEGVDELPPDGTIKTFQGAIHDVCANEGGEAGLRVSEVGASLYVMSSDLKP